MFLSLALRGKQPFSFCISEECVLLLYVAVQSGSINVPGCMVAVVHDRAHPNDRPIIAGL
jgi:hypothetical protein